MKVWKLTIKGDREDIPWRLMTHRFYTQFPSGSFEIRADNESRARALATDEFGIMLTAERPTPILTPEQIQPWMYDEYSDCVLVREENGNEGILD